MSEILWTLNKEKLFNLLEEGKRIDGRKFDEYRKISIERNYSKNAEASSKVTLGKTEVIAGIKLGLGVPFPDTPNEGILVVNGELSASAAPEFNVGPPNIAEVELSRVIDRTIRESKVIDLSKLCIQEGELVRSVFIDIYVVNYEGNAFDAAALASVDALYNAKLPKIEENKIVKGEYKGNLNISGKPSLVSFSKVNNKPLIDVNLYEEFFSSAVMHYGLIKENVCALQKSGTGFFTEKELNEMLEIAIKKSKELISLIK